jgi:hypothetical protein
VRRRAGTPEPGLVTPSRLEYQRPKADTKHAKEGEERDGGALATANRELAGVPAVVAMAEMPDWAAPCVVFGCGSAEEVTQRREELGARGGGQGAAVEARWPAS